ncbi:hypothetical protein K3555_22720 (plasmid) [Leisingera sp. M527]|uniref:hydrolase n=1 Tax=Leisingera sp. M527 TaxID=2867014 RepID=UPI0021A4AE65|nr:hydrolase [Leisingera sp. M527]UWQ35344.1 hypothetical protein K3555_22720 [Leisingera sp. M527]
MQTNTVPEMDMSCNTTGCCPKFNPAGWDGRNLHFEKKLFVRVKTRSLLHIPLNMGTVFARTQRQIKDAGAQDPKGFLVLSRELSHAEAEHFLAVTRRVPGEEMKEISGDFITRVFEGSYRRAKDWMHDMEVAAEASGKTAGRIFMFYTTCPKCARAYGKNYVIGVAEVS